MTTMTQSKSETTADEAATGAAEEKTPDARGALSRFNVTAASLVGRLGAAIPADASGKHRFVPVAVWAAGIRALTCLAYYLILVVTVFGAIPFMGAWIHQQSAVTHTVSLSADGVIAVWLVPFCFMVVMLTVAELLLMRAMWRAGNSQIAKLKVARTQQPVAEDGPRTTGNRTNRNSKKNR